MPLTSLLTAVHCVALLSVDSLTERIVLQAEQSSDSPTDVPLYDVDLVCYGIGRFSSSLPSRLQLAVLLALRSSLPLSTACSLLLYDPLLSSLEQAVLRSLGLRVIEHNEEAKRCVSRCSVFYMPHCGQALYNNLLWANWAWRHRSGENKEVQLCQPAGLHIDGEQRRKEEVLTEGDGGLSTALSSVHLSSARHSAHLGRVILIGNQLSTYIDRRSFPSGSLTASSRNNSRRSAQRLSSLSTRCPIHSSVPSTTLSTPSIDCQYDCVCLVHELRLLQCRTFDGELGQSSEEMRLAFHDTAVQWFDWSEVDAAGEAERRRVEQWLQQRLAEPKRLADDGELVSSAERDPGS